MREELKFKVEVVDGQHILKILWLIDLTPNCLNIFLDSLLDNLFVVRSGIKVSQDENE